MQRIRLKNSWRVNLNNDSKVTLEFENPTHLMKFINSGESIIKDPTYGYIYVVQMKKIKHSSLEAIVRKINLREYNLERLLS